MGNKVGTASTPESIPDSGVFFAEEFQEEMIGKFQSKILQTEWEKHQKTILTAAQQRKAVEEQWRLEFQQKLQRWKQRNDSVQSQLDQKLDDLRAKYSDYAVGIQWDMQKFEDKEKDKHLIFIEKEDSCENIRSELARCYRQVTDVRTCDVFVAAFERCSDKVSSIRT